MRIAVLGWGSLIWCPGQLKIGSLWHTDGPALPIEFARISKDGRLTLVIHAETVEQRTFWAMMEPDELSKSVVNLADREGCNPKAIGMADVNRASSETSINDWLGQRTDIDAVIWTNLRTNWRDKRNCEFSCQDALAYINGLGRQKRERAEQYIRNAPSQIQTQLRALLRSTLRWTDNDLPRILFI